MGFLKKFPTAQKIIARIDKMRLLVIRKLLPSKQSAGERDSNRIGEIGSNYRADRRLVSRIYKEQKN